MKRRNAIQLGAAFLAGGATGSNTAQPEKILYNSGDSIATPAGPVRISGWRLEFDRKDLDDYSRRHPSRSIAYTLMMPGDPDAPMIDYGPGEITIPTFYEIREKDGKLTMQGFPHYRFYRYLDVEESEGKKLLSHTSHPIRFRYYDHECINNFSNRGLFSEVPLKEDDFRELCAIMSRFDFLGGNIRIYAAYHEETEFDKNTTYKFSRRGVADPKTGRILVAANSFLHPAVPGEGSMSVFHEFVHYATDKLRYDTNQHTNRALSVAYDNLLAAAGGVAEPGPVFDIFCETSYFDQDTALIGHPWDNYDELFASACTVFGFFPEEFIRRISAKDKTTKDAAKACLGAIDSLDSDGKNREILIPAYRQIAAAIK